MAAFYGSIITQDIVKFKGKYHHYDIFATLSKGEVDRTPYNYRYDDKVLIYGGQT